MKFVIGLILLNILFMGMISFEMTPKREIASKLIDKKTQEIFLTKLMRK